MSRPPILLRTALGFTLVELITTLVLISVLAAAAAPRFFDNQVFLERGYADELAGALREAQRVAIASDCPVRFISDASGYRALQPTSYCAGAFNRAVLRNGGAPLAGAPPPDVVSPALQVEFARTGALNGAGASASVGIHVITVAQATGRVEVAP